MAIRRVLLLVFVALAVVLGTGGPARAQTSTNYNLEWHVLGGGGAPVASAHYVVNATIGQGAASPPVSTSASYVLNGGYWLPGGYRVLLPVVLRAAP